MKLWKPSKEPGYIACRIAEMKAAGIDVCEKIPANKRKAALVSCENMRKALGKRKR